MSETIDHHQPRATGPDPIAIPVVVLIVCGVLATVPFWFTDIEIRFAALFYAPHHPDGPWPLANVQPWPFLYHIAGPLAVLLGVGSLTVMVAAARRERWQPLARPALVVFLTLALSPGFVINVVFKNHWGRPRPNQLTVFGEHWEYLPPLAKGPAGRGESFPSGHASIGFSYAALWVVGRRRHPRAAAAALAGSLLLGSAMGMARIVAGNHFVSDVAWSAIMTIAVALAVQRVLQTLPGMVSRKRLHLIYAVFWVAVIGFGLIGNPVHQEIRWVSPPLPFSANPSTVDIDIDRADVEIDLEDHRDPALRVSGKIWGAIGHPRSGVRRGGAIELGDRPTISYRLRTHGALTETEGRLRFAIGVRGVDRVIVRVQRGDIRVSGGERLDSVPELDLATAEGTVNRSGPASGTRP